MAVPSPQRLDLEPEDVSAATLSSSSQSPALSSSSALARFEFESGRGNEGTKILMVEWEDDGEGMQNAGGSNSTGDWEVSWEGKSTVLSARDGAEGKIHRLYFLLAPGVSIPRIVKLAQAGGKTIQINPLPAIFPAELGSSARMAGKRGVLHTIWAKQRLSALQKEIELEMKTNGEGIGLEMALQEKQWIEENFGVSPKIIPDLQYTASPASPKSHGGGRLSEKLKGLKLGTTASELSAPSPEHESLAAESQAAHPLSPQSGDVAVSSFALFRGVPSRTPNRAVAQSPPDYLVAMQSDSRGSSRINSLDAVAGVHISRISNVDDNETEDGLFAVKMSPRSPEMTKSPFSFAAKDTAPWVKDNE